MQFDNFSTFLDMGGYGFYVWLSYGITMALLVALVIVSLGGRKKLLHDIVQKQKREQKLKEYRKKER